MKKMHGVESESRRSPDPIAGSKWVTYRGYSDDFKLELKPTGSAEVPFVGILRYTERVYQCPSVAMRGCTVASVIPVTEIFRYQDGRWIY